MKARALYGLLLALSLLSSESFARGVEILDSEVLHPTEYASIKQLRERPNYLVNPTLFVYENTGWDWSRVQAQILRASELLNQCSVGIGVVRLVQLRAHNGDEASAQRSVSYYKQKVYNVPELQSFSRPYIFFLDGQMHTKEGEGEYAVTLANTKCGQKCVERDFTLGSMFIGYRDHFKLQPSKGKRRFNTTAHEFVHALSQMDHEDRDGTLMSSNRKTTSDYISYDYCRAMMTSPLITR
jgi:hypothetical protein